MTPKSLTFASSPFGPSRSDFSVSVQAKRFPRSRWERRRPKKRSHQISGKICDAAWQSLTTCFEALGRNSSTQKS
jgi:hypothetical protein